MAAPAGHDGSGRWGTMEDRREQLRRQRDETARLLAAMESLDAMPTGFNRFNAEEELRWTLEMIEHELAALEEAESAGEAGGAP